MQTDAQLAEELRQIEERVLDYIGNGRPVPEVLTLGYVNVTRKQMRRLVAEETK